MTKVIVTKIENCRECTHLSEFVIQSTGKLLYRCRITELKVVKEIQIVRRMEKPKIPIPDWCPLDDLDPKFVDV